MYEKKFNVEERKSFPHEPDFLQIDIIKDMRFGGYFMHSRVGLITEYLGEEWFEHINFCADYGNSIGLESWIYDEDRWSSGTAGDIAAANRQNRMKLLRMNIGQAAICGLTL